MRAYYYIILFLFSMLGGCLPVVTAQVYHANDKEALRAFLRQPSAVAGKCNGEKVGLTPADTVNWTTDENWVSKIVEVDWTFVAPRRILQILHVHNNRLRDLDVSSLTLLLEGEFWCYNNYFRISTMPAPFPARSKYTPQATWDGGTIPYLLGIDLSNEKDRTIVSTTYNTQYTWYDITSGSEIAAVGVIDNGGGYFSLSNTLIGHRLRCQMTNMHFPDFTLVYEVNVIGKQPVTLELNSATHTYNKQPHPLTAVVHCGGLLPAPAVQYRYNSGATVPYKAGTYTVQAWTEGNEIFEASNTATAILVITQKPLSMPGMLIRNKTYDATTRADYYNFNVPLVDKEPGDDVSFNGLNFNADFEDKHAGPNKQVFISNGLQGIDAANYSLTTWDGLTASISPATLSVSGMTVADKIYDGSTSATVNSWGVFSRGTHTPAIFAGDNVVFNETVVTATFKNKNVGMGKPVTLSGTLGGSDAHNYVLPLPTSLTATIVPKDITITGTVAGAKVYDGTTAATITTWGIPDGVIVPDIVTLNTANIVATFMDKQAGIAKQINLSGSSVTLGGADAANYRLAAQPSGLTASITPKTISLVGTTATDKIYDGHTSATVTWGTLSGKVSGDNVTIDATGVVSEFDTKSVGNNKPVNLSGGLVTLTGNDARNYLLDAQPSGLTANITPLELLLSGTTVGNKVYDATASATVTTWGNLQGVVGADDVGFDASAATAAFATKQAGTDKPVSLSGTIALTGNDRLNYTLPLPMGMTATITPASLTVSGMTINNKIYDGSVSATVADWGILDVVLGNDVVTIDHASATVTFDTKDVAQAKPVAFTSTLAGADAINYTITCPTGLRADITAKTLTLSGTAVADKEYDGTTDATISAAGTLVGTIAGDDVTIDASTVVAAFSDKTVATNKPVALQGTILLIGNDSHNYVLTQTSGITASITSKRLSIAGMLADNKQYDGTTTATISNFGRLVGIVSGDDVTMDVVELIAAFDTKNVGIDKTVVLLSGDIALAGNDAGNYHLAQYAPSKAAITPAPLTITAGDQNKLAGVTKNLGTMAFTVSGTLYTGDAVSSVLLTSGGAAASATAGTYVIVASAAQGSGISNYIISYESGVLTVLAEARLMLLTANPDITPAFDPAIAEYEIAVPCNYAGHDVFLQATIANGNTVTFDGNVLPNNCNYYDLVAPGNRRKVSIIVSNEYDRKEYIVYITEPFPNNLIYQAHDNMLEVIANPLLNGGYDFATNAYQWFIGSPENPIEGKTSGVLYMPKGFTPSTNYGVLVTLVNDGSQRMVCPLSIQLNSSLEVYPNPATSSVTVESGLGQASLPVPVDVYSMTGVRVATFKTNAAQATIDLSNLPNGIYLLRVNGKTARIVKQ